MGKEKSFTSIEELVKSLAGRVGQLSIGTVEVKDIELMCEESRELYERLVVLRHRGREAMLKGETSIYTADEQSPEPIPQEHEEKELPVMTLDFGADPEPEEAPVAEIQRDNKPPIVENAVEPQEEPSTEAIHEEPAIAPASPKPVEQKSEAPEQKTSLAEVAASAPIEDIGASVGLNQKFMFISQIFNGKKNDYADAIAKLNGMQNATEAIAFGSQLTEHLVDDEDGQVAKQQFLDLIERRFA